jgi:protein-tyrosine-phosphatase
MTVSVVLLAVSAAGAWLGEAKGAKAGATGTVVFVCEHGNVKSLIAREWFNRLARERGLRFRAVSRGVAPGGPVPPTIAAALRGDGFDVIGFEAQALSPADTAGAVRVIGIGVALPAPAEGRAAGDETWDGIPPASERYAASRDALRARIESLLSALDRR